MEKRDETTKKWIIENSVAKDEDDRSLDCGFRRGNKWFRLRVGAVIIEEEKVLFAWNKREQFYYTVGGGIHLGENSENAIVREIYEEIGIKYEIERMAFVHEYFFNLQAENIKRECQEISFYYLMKPKGKCHEIKKDSHTLGIKEEFHWLPLQKLEDYEGYPKFLSEMIKNIRNNKCIGHFVTRND